MEHYIEMQARHQAEISALPIRFAFGDKQFAEMMKDWGLNPESDVDQVRHVGAGGYARAKDIGLIDKTLARHHQEFNAAIAADKTGGGFICEMFVTEMNNHEYSYTGDLDDVLSALGLTAHDVVNAPNLKAGMMMAHQRVLG